MDHTLLYLIAIIVVMLAQGLLQGKYQHYRKVESHRGVRGCDAARIILDRNGLSGVEVTVSQGGTLSDHYNPTTKTVHLSPEIYYKSSIASVAVAAHEVGHAIQHAQGYKVLALRNRLLPAAQFASQFGWTAIFIGFITSWTGLLYFGIALLMVIAIFQVVTLPIEFNASNRALVQLTETGILMNDETSDAKSMLNAAALTYVASLVATLVNILRLVLMIGRRNND